MKKNKTTNFNKVPIQQSDNTIINIKHKSPHTEIIDGYEDISYYKEYINENNHSKKCWNCCHDINGLNVSIPLKYNEKIFYIYGHFCSYECGGRYIIDTYKDKNMWEYYSLLNLYNNICNKSDTTIIPAPPKLLLQDFGGHMTIEEYRSNFNTCNFYEINLPPIIPIKHNSVLLENKTSISNKHNFKLYRKKPITNNIFNTMNLSNEGILESLDVIDDSL
jgi:hypothetical protein|tara:strand:- start:644 stop:1303 length:660 start_codon:yes stop_codon:yes gene_type:complete